MASNVDFGATVQLPNLSFSIEPTETIGKFINEGMSQLKNTLDTASKERNVEDSVVLKAAHAAHLALTCLKNSYKVHLDKKMESVELKIRENLERMGTLVKDVVEQNQERLMAIGERVAEIEPAPNTFRLKEMTRFIAVNGQANATTTVSIVFQGAFTDPSKALFVLNEKEYHVKQASEEQLKFDVEISADAVSRHSYTFLSGKLKLTQTKSRYMGLLGSRQETSEYETLLGVLPLGLKVRVITAPEKTKVEMCASNTFKLESNKDEWKRKIAAAGERMLPGSSILVWDEASKGQLSHARIEGSAEGDEDLWQAEVKDGQGSFTLYGLTTRKDVKIHAQDSSWGESKIFANKTDEVIQLLVVEILGSVFLLSDSNEETAAFSYKIDKDGYSLGFAGSDKVNTTGFEQFMRTVRSEASTNNKLTLPESKPEKLS